MAKLTRLTWFGARVSSKVQLGADRRVKIAAEFLKREIQRSMKKGGGGAKQKRATGRVRRSKPGQPPFAQTGRLRQSIFSRRDGVAEYNVGTNVSYGIFHELGIRYRRVGFQKRPFIMPALRKNKKTIAKILSTGILK